RSQDLRGLEGPGTSPPSLSSCATVPPPRPPPHSLLVSAQHVVSAEEGLVALPYEQTHGAFSRVHQFSKLLMYVPASGMYSCPLAMTDGAARLFQVMQRDKHVDPLALQHAKEAFAHLTSRSGEEFWTSGQWMTEQASGSDV